MPYYTYENWRAKGHRATVHVGSCGFCKGGKGMAGGSGQTMESGTAPSIR